MIKINLGKIVLLPYLIRYKTCFYYSKKLYNYNTKYMNFLILVYFQNLHKNEIMK